MVRSKSISTPIRCVSNENLPYPLARRPTLLQGNNLTLYTVVKPHNKEIFPLSFKKNVIQVNKGDLVQLISKDKDPNYVYVKSITNISEGLVPLNCLQEVYHLPSKDINNSDDDSLVANKLSIGSIQTVNSLSHHHLMELTPPTSPSTITSNTFSLGCLSRNSRASPRSSSTLIKKPFDTESTLISMCIDSVENKNGRLLYTLKLMNQLKQETWKEVYYQDLYRLHLEMVSHPTYNSEELFLPRLPAPLPPNISHLPINNINKDTIRQYGTTTSNNNNADSIRLERIQQINLYIQAMFRVLSMEPESSILRQKWFSSILTSTEFYNDNNIKIKVKVLYDGDYHVFKCQYVDINDLLKLQDTVALKLGHDNHSPTTIYTAVINGWYKVNLTNEEIYTGVLIKIRESQQFTLEIYD